MQICKFRFLCYVFATSLMHELYAFSKKLERLHQLHLALFQIYKLYTTYEARFATVSPTKNEFYLTDC